MKIAVDIGGVLGPSLKDRLLSDGSYNLYAEPDFVSGHMFNQWVGEGVEVYIISRACSAEKVSANWAWLWKHFRGLKAENIHIFDGPRSHKAELVAKLGIEVMIDDRFEVLASMPSEVILFAFKSDPEEEKQFAHLLAGREVHKVVDFLEVDDCLFDGP